MDSLLSRLEGLRFTLQEALIALLPYIVIFSIAQIAGAAARIESLAIPQDWRILIDTTAWLLSYAMPLVLIVSISFHLAALLHIDRIISSCLCLAIFLSQMKLQDRALLMPDFAAAFAILTPIAALTIFAGLLRLPLPRLEHGALSYNLTTSINLALPAVATFLLTHAAMHLVHLWGGTIYHATVGAFTDLSHAAGVTLYSLASQFLWFFGLHGENMLRVAVDKSYLASEIVPGLSHDTFFDQFGQIGGCGMTISLGLAVLLCARDRHMRTVALLGLPFAVFNVSEIFIFGLPLVLNLNLLLPFLLVPLACLTVGYAVVSLGLLTFSGATVPWATPVLLNIYLSSGSLAGVAVQAGLILFGALLYAPFVLRYSRSAHGALLSKVLHEEADFSETMRRQHGRAIQDTHARLRLSSRRTREAVDLLRRNALLLYFQPKIDTMSGACIGFEALLRVRLRDGTVIGPSFLETLENAGFARMIDRWVCRRALEQLPQMRDALGDNLTICINLHPETISDASTVDWIAQAFAGLPVGFEIIERGMRRDGVFVDNLKRLRGAGANLSIDDFGAGYSNLAELVNLPIDTIKFDRTLLVRAECEKGRALYTTLAGLCRELGFQVVAEGVETETQYRLVRSCGIDVVQGWYFAKALPMQEALAYALAHRAPSAAVARPDPAPAAMPLALPSMI
jgi:EAL domain-containing protein (putative c-di-GMP-specific phosphodiesterase class I)/cellobiose-specific phosphotransferase system component IIC